MPAGIRSRATKPRGIRKAVQVQELTGKNRGKHTRSMRNPGRINRNDRNPDGKEQIRRGLTQKRQNSRMGIP